MAKDPGKSGDNPILSDRQDRLDYTPTEELKSEDFEELARSVLRQQKISATVSSHLTPQFAEHDKHHQGQRDKNRLQQGNDRHFSLHASEQVSINSDILDSLLIGLAQLVDSQRRFADEYGLDLGQVFNSDLSEIQKRGSVTVLQEWLEGQDPDASTKLDKLFEDLTHHQVGILGSLDKIAQRTIKYLGPELTTKNLHGLARLGPVWPHYKVRNRKLAADQQSRKKLIISPGVAYGYTRIKNKVSKKRAK